MTHDERMVRMTRGPQRAGGGCCMPRRNGAAKRSRQIAMVCDLNKCMGCQTCSVACKMLWTRDDDGSDGTDYMWWCSVNTMPGRGYPKDWEQLGGGYRDGRPEPGVLPGRQDFGGGWGFNYEEGYYGGKGACVH